MGPDIASTTSILLPGESCVSLSQGCCCPKTDSAGTKSKANRAETKNFMAPSVFFHFGLGYCNGGECNGEPVAFGVKIRQIERTYHSRVNREPLLACKVLMA